MYVATAADWRDPASYARHEDRGELFPDLGAAGTEDPFVYLDDAGFYHAVFHHMYGTGTATQWWLDATGGHAFSRDGWAWTYTGVCYGDATARYDTPQGRGGVVDFDDGTSFAFTRLERPHLLFEGKRGMGALRGDPTHLLNAAQYGDGTDPGTGANNDDAAFTIIRPINQA